MRPLPCQPIGQPDVRFDATENTHPACSRLTHIYQQIFAVSFHVEHLSIDVEAAGFAPNA
jgi:hypothetical protein